MLIINIPVPGNYFVDIFLVGVAEKLLPAFVLVNIY